MQLKLPQEFAGPLGLETILVAILAHHGKPCDLRVWSGWRDSNPRPPAPKAPDAFIQFLDYAFILVFL